MIRSPVRFEMQRWPKRYSSDSPSPHGFFSTQSPMVLAWPEGLSLGDVLSLGMMNLICIYIYICMCVWMLIYTYVCTNNQMVNHKFSLFLKNIFIEMYSKYQQVISWVIGKDSTMQDASTSFHYSCGRLTPRLFLLLTLPQVLWNWSRWLQVRAHPATSSFARNAVHSYALTSNLQDHCQLIPTSSSWNLNKGWCYLFLLCINSRGVHLIMMEGI